MLVDIVKINSYLIAAQGSIIPVYHFNITENGIKPIWGPIFTDLLNVK